MKNCPFCESQNLCIQENVISMKKGQFSYCVVCNECHARGPISYMEAAAILKWNRDTVNDILTRTKQFKEFIND